jgi:hypothetical protein
MLQSSVSSETLAHWIYTQAEWRDFVNYVLNNRTQGYKSLRYWVIGIIVAALLVMSFLVLIPYLMLKPYESIWREDVWGPVFGVLVVTCVILAALVFLRLLSQEKDRRLKLSSSGEVLITLTAVIVNGSSFDWGYEKSGWRFQNVERKTVATVEGKNLEILQFNCSLETIGVKTKTVIDKMERVPIPTGKETEAENVIERLCAEKNRFAENYA